MDEETINEIVEDEQNALDYYQGYVDGSNASNTNKQKWYQSKVLWIAVLSLIGVIVINVFDLIDSDAWNTITTAILSLMSVFGIINSPSSKGELGGT